MTWRIEEEDIELVLSSHTLTGKRKLLVNDGGDTIRKVVTISANGIPYDAVWSRSIIDASSFQYDET